MESFRKVGKVAIDDIDRTILTYLDRNARTTIAEISKDSGVQRDTIRYRLNRLEKNKVIELYQVILNPHTLGHPIHCLVTLSLTKEGKNNIKSTITHLKKQKNIIYVSQTTEYCDICLGICTKSLDQFESVIREIKGKYADHIDYYESSLIIQEYQYASGIKLIHPNKEELKTTFESHHLLKYDHIAKLDEKDKIILESLNNNARRSITDISKETGIQRDSVRYRLTKMEENHVIRFYHAVLNSSRLGYPHHIYLFLSTNCMSTKEEDRLHRYFEDFDQAVYIAKTAGRWHYIVYLVCKDEQNFNDIMDQINSEFPSAIKDYNHTIIDHEWKFEEMVYLIEPTSKGDKE